ncbi:hypothetical protein BABINDRAFT_176679 [Babjeviella inositovora NRRL Y-12698]|uniref:DNA-binding protein RAP1 n=1 Tax=Babjeviella inositovora NRRL Y-12698 TaxID=984486 RepID=A0A1E3QN20_9ASCO|nr:uncharacterized protein BABINDRAFT_176679 [Babjeviella inositovora NRRL Y-12698]ODQ79106.1 hypothetical protein BABINDRAFT_176679 [Babjeviella inositovora NRRL Y-12698]
MSEFSTSLDDSGDRMRLVNATPIFVRKDGSPMGFHVPQDEPQREALIRVIETNGGIAVAARDADMVISAEYNAWSPRYLPDFIFDSAAQGVVLRLDSFRTRLVQETDADLDREFMDEPMGVHSGAAPEWAQPPVERTHAYYMPLPDATAPNRPQPSQPRVYQSTPRQMPQLSKLRAVVPRRPEANLFTPEEDEIILEEVRRNPSLRNTHSFFEVISRKMPSHSGPSIRHRYRTHLQSQLEYVYKINPQTNKPVTVENGALKTTNVLPRPLKLKYTADDDYALAVALLLSPTGPTTSRGFYKMFAERHTNHSADSWRDRYRKFLAVHGVVEYKQYYETEKAQGRVPEMLKNMTSRKNPGAPSIDDLVRKRARTETSVAQFDALLGAYCNTPEEGTTTVQVRETTFDESISQAVHNSRSAAHTDTSILAEIYETGAETIQPQMRSVKSAAKSSPKKYADSSVLEVIARLAARGKPKIRDSETEKAKHPRADDRKVRKSPGSVKSSPRVNSPAKPTRTCKHMFLGNDESRAPPVESVAAATTETHTTPLGSRLKVFPSGPLVSPDLAKLLGEYTPTRDPAVSPSPVRAGRASKLPRVKTEKFAMLTQTPRVDKRRSVVTELVPTPISTLDQQPLIDTLSSRNPSSFPVRTNVPETIPRPVALKTMLRFASSDESSDESAPGKPVADMTASVSLARKMPQSERKPTHSATEVRPPEHMLEAGKRWLGLNSNDIFRISDRKENTIGLDSESPSATPTRVHSKQQQPVIADSDDGPVSKGTSPEEPAESNTREAPVAPPTPQRYTKEFQQLLEWSAFARIKESSFSPRFHAIGIQEALSRLKGLAKRYPHGVSFDVLLLDLENHVGLVNPLVGSMLFFCTGDLFLVPQYFEAAMAHGKNSQVQTIPGVWCTKYDLMLRSKDEEADRFLCEFHGEENVIARREFLLNFPDDRETGTEGLGAFWK